MEDEQITTIYEQLSSYCDCLHNVSQTDVDELIQLISVYTCWAQNPCETFMFGDRQEVVELPDCVCDCDVFEFEPFYVPFDSETFTFTLIKQQGIEEESTPITQANYSEVDQNFKMILPLQSCRCLPVKCECPTTYKLLVTYKAGFELLPDCLLPIFCEALQYIKDRRNCDCSQCSSCDNKYESDVTEVLVDDAANLTDELRAYLIRLLSKQYKRQLSLISLCERPNELWGFRV